ncbi:MAG TPA: hypothetical protein DDW30_01985 [Clostridiales bacterium]|nr:hypothetical protein [Clostridiales bacterium]
MEERKDVFDLVSLVNREWKTQQGKLKRLPRGGEEIKTKFGKTYAFNIQCPACAHPMERFTFKNRVVICINNVGDNNERYWLLGPKKIYTCVNCALFCSEFRKFREDMVCFLTVLDSTEYWTYYRIYRAMAVQFNHVKSDHEKKVIRERKCTKKF